MITQRSLYKIIQFLLFCLETVLGISSLATFIYAIIKIGSSVWESILLFFIASILMLLFYLVSRKTKYEKKQTEEETIQQHDESLASTDKFVESDVLFRFVDTNRNFDEFTIDIDKHGKISDEDMRNLLQQDYVVIWEAKPHQYIIRKNLLKMIKDKIRFKPNLYLVITVSIAFVLFMTMIFVSKSWTEVWLYMLLTVLALILHGWIWGIKFSIK